MSKQEKLSEEEYEKIAQHNYLLGQYVGLNEASGIVMGMAQEHFRVGLDADAKTFRELANRLDKLAQDRHPRKDK